MQTGDLFWSINLVSLKSLYLTDLVNNRVLMIIFSHIMSPAKEGVGWGLQMKTNPDKGRWQMLTIAEGDVGGLKIQNNTPNNLLNSLKFHAN